MIRGLTGVSAGGALACAGASPPAGLSPKASLRPASWAAIPSPARSCIAGKLLSIVLNVLLADSPHPTTKTRHPAMRTRVRCMAEAPNGVGSVDTPHLQ